MGIRGPVFGCALALVTAGTHGCLFDDTGYGVDNGNTDGGGGTASLSGANASSGSPSTGGAGGAPEDICGDGLLAPNEECDDGNRATDDGCSGCAVDPGFACEGSPSRCTPSQTLRLQSGSVLPLIFPADAYDGSSSSMTCVNFSASFNEPALIRYVGVTIGIESEWVGDLVVKLVNPSNQTVTLLSRPGLDEVQDDGSGASERGANLSPTYPIGFQDQNAQLDGEQMGQNLSASDVVCEDDANCTYRPSPGAGSGIAMSDFTGMPGSGSWKLCIADAAGSTGGALHSAVLELVAW